MINVPRVIAGNEVCQIGGCASAITVEEIAAAERKNGVEGDMQIVFFYPDNGKLRVPVTMDALIKSGITSSEEGA